MHPEAKYDDSGRVVNIEGLKNPEKTQLRFNKKCIPSQSHPGCIEWQGFITNWGYGRVSATGKNGLNLDYNAHRLAWVLAGNTLPPTDMVLRHRCDNPRCVNPAHLEIGTHAENAQDREGRSRANHVAGEANGRSTLTEKCVLEIRHATYYYGFYNDWARRLGVDKKTIRLARQGKRWTYLPMPGEPGWNDALQSHGLK